MEGLSKHYFSGVSYQQKGLYKEAEKKYLKAIELNSEYYKAYCNYAFFLKGEVIKINPNSSSAHCSLGAALAEAGKMDEAILEFRRAVELDPNNINACEALERALG